MKPVILLHGALGSLEQLMPIASSLQKKGFEPHPLEFSGHGQTPNSDRFNIQQFSEELLEFINQKSIQGADIFGYSMGGYVALYTAANHPVEIGKIITLGTKFHWDEKTALNEQKNLDPDTILQKVPKYAVSLEKRHGAEWKNLLQRTAAMMLEMGHNNPLKPEHFSKITKACMIGIGDNDQMVTLDETLKVYKQLPNARMYMLPNTKHPMEMVNTHLLSEIISTFLNE